MFCVYCLVLGSLFSVDRQVGPQFSDVVAAHAKSMCHYIAKARRMWFEYREITTTEVDVGHSLKAEIGDFGSGTNCSLWHLFGFFFLAHVEPKHFFAFARENSLVQPLPVFVTRDNKVDHFW